MRVARRRGAAASGRAPPGAANSITRQAAATIGAAEERAEKRPRFEPPLRRIANRGKVFATRACPSRPPPQPNRAVPRGDKLSIAVTFAVLETGAPAKQREISRKEEEVGARRGFQPAHERVLRRRLVTFAFFRVFRGLFICRRARHRGYGVAGDRSSEMNEHPLCIPSQNGLRPD